MLPDIVAFFSLVIGILSLSLVVFIYLEQKKQTNEIRQAVGYIEKETKESAESRKRIEEQIAIEMKGFCQVMLMWIYSLQGLQDNIISRKDKFDKESRIETETFRHKFFNDVNNFENEITNHKFYKKSSILSSNFDGKLNDDFKKLCVKLLWQNQLLIIDREFQTYRKESLDESEKTVNDMYSKVKPYLSNKDQKDLIRTIKPKSNEESKSKK